MNAAPEKCIQCGGALEEGFIKDNTITGAYGPIEWIEGAPEASLWSGVKTTGKKRYNVITYRCTECGRLEFYT